jgi:lipid-A-disaccharide synthase
MSKQERPFQIAIAACEPSADRQAAALLTALRERAGSQVIQSWGIGGSHLRAAGMDVQHDSDPWATIGVLSAIAHIPYGLAVRADFKRRLAADPPDALVLIDAGAFNVPLGRWAKAQRLCPVFYYFPSGSWRKTPNKGHWRMKDAADVVVTPFPWSAALLRQAGSHARFVGHPLLDLVRPSLEPDEFWTKFGLDPQRPLIALLPGSRRMELEQILPPLLGAAGEIARRLPGVQFALALAASAPRDMVERIIRREQKTGGRAARLQLLMSQAGDKLAQIAHSTLGQTLTPVLPRLATTEGLTLPMPPNDEEPAVVRERPTSAPAPLVIVEDLTYDVMARSDLVITKSGTSTLEAAVLHKPMIIVYRLPPIVALEGRMRWKKLGIAHIGMPNILAGERIVPELLQDEVTPEAIADLAVGMLLEPERLLLVKERLADTVRTTLGEPGGVRRAAEVLYTLMARETL